MMKKSEQKSRKKATNRVFITKIDDDVTPVEIYMDYMAYHYKVESSNLDLEKLRFI
ncbi:MAG: hypothetical protein NTZ80_00375 [Patescibacteria group bacterium]|nr:hypothetical protein [Patescibacteria group bacterium]